MQGKNAIEGGKQEKARKNRKKKRRKELKGSRERFESKKVSLINFIVTISFNFIVQEYLTMEPKISHRNGGRGGKPNISNKRLYTRT